MAESGEWSRRIAAVVGAALMAEPGGTALAAGAAPGTSGAGEGLLWSRNLPEAIFNTTGLIMPAGRLAAGTFLNPPREVEMFEVDGTGDPVWVFPGTDFDVAVSRRAEVVAALDRVSAQSLVLHKFHPGSNVPDWSFEIPSATPASFRALTVSPDGSTIAVLVTRQGGGEGNNARLYYFGPDSPVPLGIFDAPVGTFGRNIAITDDGAYIAFMGGASVFVVDRDADDLRFSTSAGASNDALAISGDGTQLMYGWMRLFLREWDGSTYALRWSRAAGGFTLGLCAASADGDTLVAAWRSSDFLRNRIELLEPSSSTPVWTYLYDQGGGSLQDVPGDVAITASGSHVAVASWGDQLNTNPEVHVFARSGPEPIFTQDTPGSMFDIDVARGPGGTLLVSACGKHIHANTSGRGGDLFAMRLEIECPADLDANGAVGFSDLLAILAAWGPCPGCPEDLDGGGGVGFADILLVLAAWGPCG